MTDKRNEARRMAEVMLAYADGEEVEFQPIGWLDEWWDTGSDPLWNWRDFDYRVKQTMDEIPWDVIDERWNYTARNKSGDLCFFTNEPERKMSVGCWLLTTGSGYSCTSHGVLNIKRGTVDWKDSLQRRPGAEEDDD